MTKDQLIKDLRQNGAVLETEVDALLNYVCSLSQITSANLQLRFKLGYNQADRIMAQLEKHNIVSPRLGSAPRTVLITLKDL